MNDDTIVDAEIVPQHASDDTVIQVHLRELPRDDEPAHLPAVIGHSALDKALAFHRLQEDEIAKGGRFDWHDWLQSLLAAQGRRDVATYADLIAIGERRGFFA
jgi:hypothetical protein